MAAFLGIRGLFGGAFSRGVDAILAPYAKAADWFKVTDWFNEEKTFRELARQDGKIVIVIHSMGWVPVAKYLNKHLSGKDVFLVTLDPARKGLDGTYPLITPLDGTRHLNIWQTIPFPQSFDRMAGAKNIKWHQPIHHKLDDRGGVQEIVRDHINSFLKGSADNAQDARPEAPMTKPFYIGNYIPLKAGDIAAVAREFKLKEAHIRAVLEVESSGKGSHTSGAVNALYEPHIAYRYTSGATRDALVKAGLAYPKWIRNYPPTSYPRIDKCVEIVSEVRDSHDQGVEIAALSTSWGLGQVMGFNHRACGFDNAADMVRNFAKSEGNQLRGMMAFIESKGLLDNLRDLDWAGFALGYNGQGYAANKYDERLRDAYDRWLNASPSAPVPTPPKEPEAPPEPPVGDLESISTADLLGASRQSLIRLEQMIAEIERRQPGTSEGESITQETRPALKPVSFSPEPKESEMENILDKLPFNGNKTVIGFIAIAVVAIMEGHFQIQIPEYVETMIWSFTGVAGAHKVEKLVRYYRDFTGKA